jgi:hypothetical protein
MLDIAMINHLRGASGRLAKHVQGHRDGPGEGLRCKKKRERWEVAAPGASSAMETHIRWPYHWTERKRPPHVSSLAAPPKPSDLPPGYADTVKALVALTDRSVIVPDMQEHIDTFNSYAVPIFHWARAKAEGDCHKFTNLLNDSFVNLTVRRPGGDPRMYHDCGDMVITVINADRFITGVDKQNVALYNCVGATHFVLLGHLYWKEMRPSDAGDAIAVFNQSHISIRHLTSPRYYENTAGFFLTRTQYAQHFDASYVRPEATLALSEYSDLVCSHHINTREMCRDALTRGCSMAEALAWSACDLITESVELPPCSHFMCSCERIYTPRPTKRALAALKCAIRTIKSSGTLHVGFPDRVDRVALWLAMHQTLKRPRPTTTPKIRAKNATELVLELCNTYKRTDKTPHIRNKDAFRRTLVRLGVPHELLERIMRHWNFLIVILTK